MSYSNLSNREVLFIFFNNLKWVKRYETIFQDGGVKDHIELPGIGYIKTFEMLTPEEMDDMKETDKHYLLVMEVHDRLLPIVELIKESMPATYVEVDEIINEIEDEV